MFTRLRGVTLDRLNEVIADFTAADWCQLSAEHLDPAGLDLFDHLAVLGVDLDDDPIAIFCRIYLAARDVDFYPRCTADQQHAARIHTTELRIFPVPAQRQLSEV